MNRCNYSTTDGCKLLYVLSGEWRHLPRKACMDACGINDRKAQRKTVKRFVPDCPTIPENTDLLEWIKKCVADGTIKLKGPKRQETKKKLPPMVTMEKNLANFAKDAAVKWITDGKVRCCAEQSALRWQECQTCPHMTMIKGKERCATFPGDEKDAGCGCFLRTKVKYAASRCKYWNYIDKEYEVQD